MLLDQMEINLYSVEPPGFEAFKSIERHKCTYCTRGFPFKYLLDQHVRTHTGERPYVCDVCKACFANVSNFNMHKRIHSGDKPFKCTVCVYATVKSSDLRRHMKRHCK